MLRLSVISFRFGGVFVGVSGYLCVPCCYYDLTDGNVFYKFTLRLCVYYVFSQMVDGCVLERFV